MKRLIFLGIAIAVLFTGCQSRVLNDNSDVTEQTQGSNIADTKITEKTISQKSDWYGDGAMLLFEKGENANSLYIVYSEKKSNYGGLPLVFIEKYETSLGFEKFFTDEGLNLYNGIRNTAIETDYMIIHARMHLDNVQSGIPENIEDCKLIAYCTHDSKYITNEKAITSEDIYAEGIEGIYALVMKMFETRGTGTQVIPETPRS